MIARELAVELVGLVGKNDQQALVNFLKQKIIGNEFTIADLFDYARDTQFSQKFGKPYVITAEILNSLGVMISSLENPEQKKQAGQFFKLSAERNNPWGCKNYASALFYGRYGFEKSSEQALVWVKKAIELANGAEKSQFKYLLFLISQENHLYAEANEALVTYLSFLNQAREKNEKSLKLALSKLKEALDILQDRLSNKDLTLDDLRTDLPDLEPIIKAVIDLPEFVAQKERALFIKAQLHEKLGEKSQAWLAYCKIANIKSDYYAKALEARKNLLLAEIQVQPEHVPVLKKPSLFTLPQGVPFPTSFAKQWEPQAEWFDSVDEKALEAEYKKRSARITSLIAAKKIEIELVKESKPENYEQKTQELEAELKTLSSAEEQLDERYQQSLPAKRAVLRRHATERHFFNPWRSKKLGQITELAQRIIEQRFALDDKVDRAVNLTGYSSRQYISAERLFQEAAVRLSGDASPELGIPVRRRQPWNMGYASGTNLYGPVEKFKVGETEIRVEHRVDPKRQRLGDSYLPDHGTYARDIHPFLNKLTAKDAEKEKQVAKFMRRYSVSHQSVSLEELTALNAELTQDDVHKFNQICFLIMEKEQAQWHSADREDFQIGMSVAFARCLTMIEVGFIRFEQAFDQSELFSVYSHTGLANSLDQVAKSCSYIESLYQEYLKQEHRADHLTFFRKHPRGELATVLSRKKMRGDAQAAYGGMSDTDGEGYETDLSMG